eukprot:TRINITY_DN8283_c0_g1_i11.p1 TRINITY_DN8283_c0_g1~~TRINITY_DN8283_c0_g1_i11.p1  ORF type:complete len:163 (+),score=26.14 TRINITY_DN8283_c0_g1_i11:73-561(+)
MCIRDRKRSQGPQPAKMDEGILEFDDAAKMKKRSSPNFTRFGTPPRDSNEDDQTTKQADFHEDEPKGRRVKRVARKPLPSKNENKEEQLKVDAEIYIQLVHIYNLTVEFMMQLYCISNYVLRGIVQQFRGKFAFIYGHLKNCLLYTSPSPRDGLLSRMPSSA